MNPRLNVARIRVNSFMPINSRKCRQFNDSTVRQNVNLFETRKLPSIQGSLKSLSDAVYLDALSGSLGESENDN